MISADTVKALREQTGISVMQCKAALEEAGGDSEKALAILKKRGAAVAAKKSDRSLGAGTASAYVHANKEIAAMVVLRSETDFVAKNDEFMKLAYELALQVAASKPQYVKREDINEADMASIRALFEKEVANKPENLKNTILTGKVDAYLKGVVLLEQPYIKNPDQTVQELIQAAVHKFGERIEVGDMVRISVR